MELHRVYMPFIKQGGLFFKTKQDANLEEIVNVQVRLFEHSEPWSFTAKVCWVNPAQTQRGRPQGIGVELGEAQELKLQIEKRLGAKLNSQLPTYTL